MKYKWGGRQSTLADHHKQYSACKPTTDGALLGYQARASPGLVETDRDEPCSTTHACTSTSTAANNTEQAQATSPASTAPSSSRCEPIIVRQRRSFSNVKTASISAGRINCWIPDEVLCRHLQCAANSGRFTGSSQSQPYHTPEGEHRRPRNSNDTHASEGQVS